MSPLDDELHAALHAKAAAVPTPSDPLAGIESRARSIRRRRLAASLAGGLLVIAAVAVAVPALVPDHRSANVPSTQPTLITETTAPAPTPTAAPTESGPPANVLTSWPQRGSSTHAPQVSDVLHAFALAMNRESDERLARYRQLFVGDTGKGEAFTVGQAWFADEQQAYSVSYNVPPNGGSPELFLGKPTPTDPAVLAWVVPNLAGMSDLLIVVPKPGTGQVLYASSDTGAFRPITGQDRYDGVVLIDRQLSDTHDQLELLDGNGDMNRPTFKGPVAPLLCGLKECG